MKKIFYITIALLFWFRAYSQYIDPDEANDRYRALWVYTIAENVIWPDENKIDTFTIGVYTRLNNLYKQIKENARPVKGKPVKVIHFTRLKKITPTNILVVGSDKNLDIYKINAIIKDNPTLIITDRLDDPDNYMVNIRPFNVGSKRININKDNINAHHLKVTETLIYHGGSEKELKDLYQKQKEELEKQKAEIEEKIKENQRLQEEIAKQKALLEEQTKEIQKQKEELNKLMAQINEKEAQLQKNIETLQKQEALIKSKQRELFLKQQELQKKKLELKQKNDEIKKKQQELATLEEKIKKTQNVLKQAHQQIQTQKDIILIVAIFLLIVMIFAILILRAYRQNKRMNEELKRKNAEILKQKEQIELQAKLLEETNKELEKLSIVAENAQNGIIIMDKEGNIEWLNAGFTKMYGYTLQLFINELDRNIIKASQNPEIKKYYEKCINEKVNVTYETESRKRNGEKIWTKTTLTPILNEEGEIVRLVAIDTDITEIKLAEQEIRKQHEKIKKQAEELQKANIELQKLSIVAQKIENAVIITDAEGNYEWVNPAFERIFGFTLNDLLRTKPNIIKYTTKQQVKASIEKALKTKQSVNYQFQTKNKLGKTIWIQATITPLVNDKGEIEKLIFVDSDITAIKEAEREILEKNQELLAQKEKIEFQNKQIQASIKYAQTIQQTILPPKEQIARFFESELIFLPKDIVSGDFYWFLHLEQDKTCFAAAVDCTGHGVPGAFMSLISSRILNEIVIEKGIHDPAQILETADQTIKQALRQDQSLNRDGLDIVLTKIYRKEQKDGQNIYTIEYAGAKRPLIYLDSQTNKINKVEATRRSIGGIFLKVEKPFTTNTLTLKSNDVLYLMTDGYIDQNDKNRKRFGSKRFFELLEKIKNLPISEQKQILLDELKKFMDTSPQRDDITLWILKLK